MRLCASFRKRRASASNGLLGTIAAADEALLVAAARLRSPEVDRGVTSYSQLGNSGLGWVVLGVAVSLAKRDARPAIATAVAVWGTLGVNYGVKLIAKRERPNLEDAPQTIEAPTSSSFPSSHAAMSAAAAVVLGDAIPFARLPLKLAAVSMAYTRVHLGVHHPSDVVAGYVLGAVTGRVARLFVPARRRR